MSARRIAAAIVGAEIGLAGLFGAFGVLHSNAVAYADTGCFTADWEPMECPTGEIALSEIHNPDMFPVCELEDCSDQPGQVGMWPFYQTTRAWRDQPGIGGCRLANRRCWLSMIR
jgi:hypothetical protein